MKRINKKMRLIIFIFILGLCCKGSASNSNTLSNVSDEKGKLSEDTASVYGFDIGEKFSVKVREFIGKENALKNDAFNLCLEIDNDTKSIKFAFADFMENEFVSLPFKVDNNQIFEVKGKKGRIYLKKYLQDGYHKMHLSFDAEIISSESNVKKSSSEKKYGIVYVEGVIDAGKSLSDCVEGLRSQIQFQREGDTFSKEIEEHGPWGSEEGTKKEK